MTALQELRPSHREPIEKNRWPGILFAVVLHSLVIYVLMAEWPHSTIALEHEKTQAMIFADLPQESVPPARLPDFKPPVVEAELPDVEIRLAEAAPSAAMPTKPSPVTVTHAPPEITTTPPIPITSHAVTADDYPPASVRLSEEGVVKIRYLVQADGSVGQCAVTASSGSSRLDNGACAMVKRRWKFTPATQKGKPVAAYMDAEVSFALLPNSEN